MTFVRARPCTLFFATLITITFTAISFPIALHFKTATSYLMGAAAIITPAVLPLFFALLNPMPTWTILLPAAAQFRLLLVAIGVFPSTSVQISAMVFVTSLTTLAAIWAGQKALKKEFGEQ